MLPPIAPEVSTANPKFDALYRDLCGNKLNIDGTTKAVDGKAQRERDLFSADLRKVRVQAAKQTLVKSYLQSLASQADELPTDLQELVAVIAAAQYAQLSRDDASLLHDDIEKFKESITLTALLVSKAAAEDITSLAQILSTSDRSDWRDIPSRIVRAKEDLTTSEDRIAALRLDLAHEASALHAVYRQVLETGIRILEQTIHGSVSRATKVKADYLATVAEGMARKLQVQQNQLLAQTRSPEMQDALRGKSEDLERESTALRRKIREAEGRLEEYRHAKALKGVANEYAEILRATDKVQADIDRLERQHS